MDTQVGRSQKVVPVGLGVITLLGVGLLFAWHFFPASFPAGAHAFLAAFPLTLIAVAYLAHQAGQRPTPFEWLKAILLATAFLFWAANQMWPELRQATLFNDLAIGLFVLDVFLIIIGRPAASP